MFIRPHDGLDSVPNTELEKHVREMGLDGGLADEEVLGDLGVVSTCRYQPQHLQLAISQRVSQVGDDPPGRRVTGELFDDPPGSVLTFIPFTAPFVVPIRVAFQEIAWWEYAAAVAGAIVTIGALVRFAGRVYAGGLLHYGRRLGLRQAYRSAETS